MKYTLITDGSSDRALTYILDWLCKQHYNGPIEGMWFDPRPFGPPTLPLDQRICKGFELYPCDLMFIHRDSENASPQQRYQEISKAVKSLHHRYRVPPFICVVPVRMTEAWLLSNEKAIRKAAGNPNGRMDLNLPTIQEVEKILDVKGKLLDVLKNASGLNSHRRRRIKIGHSRIRIAELTEEFSILRSLKAFKRLENEVKGFFSTITSIP